MEERHSTTCRAKVGLLFLRDCGRIPKTECSNCGRPVCSEHKIKADEGYLCPECGSKNRKTARNGAAASSRHRRGYYDRHGYSPYYYGHHHYYSDRDYRTFDDTPQNEAAALGETFDDDGGIDDVGEAAGAADFMES